MAVTNSNSGARILQRLPRNMRGKGSANSTMPSPTEFSPSGQQGLPHTSMKAETPHMAREQRELIQAALGKKFRTRVQVRDHALDMTSGNYMEGMEYEMENSQQLPHPLHQNQRGDGIALSQITDQTVRLNLENAQREQEMEKQLRLGLSPSMSPSAAPKPGYS